jgi:LacI family transcriptional regulator
MAAHGLALDDTLIMPGRGVAEDGVAAIARWKESNDRPTAFVCKNDHVALGALNAAFRAGIETPRQLSIIGADDISAASLVLPGLTTVRTNHDELARSAVETMVRRIADPELPRMEIVIEPTLVVRESTAAI